MATILLSRVFMVNNRKVTLTAGVKDGAALVVMGLPDAAGHNQLANITIEYPMKTARNAVHFVENATEDTAARGLAKYEAEVSELAERLNRALNRPYEPDVGYRRRGK
ncbi:TPA: hypothetical protein JG832_002406 [Enterobacter hormaechei subsp. xiangfangensis]|nr:hypothetical protein [Enterobacter hormaechei subsp. xiangfangensis]HAV1890544.1 hypothetical protein [Enterobacter hormaechei subsp. xiangfangensis]